MQQVDQAALDTLACDLTQRPRGASSFADVAAALRSVRRDGDSLVLEYDAAAAATVAAVVEAERRCCPEIGWELAGGAAARVRITASDAQLAVFESFLTLPD